MTDYFSTILNLSNDAIISKDLKGHITLWNNSACKLFGYTSDEAIGRHISLIIPPQNIKDDEEITNRICSGQSIENFETIRRHKNGDLINVSHNIAPIFDDKGQITGSVAVVRDITPLKQAEKATAYLSAIIQSSDDAIISKDLNGMITSWNKSAERIFGYTAEEAVGKNVTLIIPTERLAEEEKILVTLKTGERVDHYETMRRHKKGHLVPVSLTVSPILDKTGRVIGASKVSRDITDRLLVEKSLKETALKKEDFIANMSHELRTPMNAVIGLTDLLATMDGLPEKANKFISTLKISADNMMDLINDLLDFAKMQSGSFEIEHIEFILRQQIEKVIAMANIKAHQKRLNLNLTLSPDLNQYYMGDPLRISQILTNLVSNAIKFTEMGSIKVDISKGVSTDDKYTAVIMTVKDTGIGIAPDQIENIFDKFTQADTSITRKYGGSGLGLAIVKNCVEKMNGTVALQSELNVGTTFTVTLPLENTGRIVAVENFAPNVSIINAKPKKNILLVEDYEPNILVVSEMLLKMGYDYDTAVSGYEALKKFSSGLYDVVLMDIQMQGMDGLETTKRIRSLEREGDLNRTTIIAMTAHVRDQDREKCRESGMDDFIPKPFEYSFFVQKIKNYIESHQKPS